MLTHKSNLGIINVNSQHSNVYFLASPMMTPAISGGQILAFDGGLRFFLSHTFMFVCGSQDDGTCLSVLGR